METLLKAMPGWLKQGLDAHVTVDGRARQMRDPLAYTELLCGLHPVGTPRLCADRLAATSERTGINRFALLVEGSGDLAATEENVRRLRRRSAPAPRVNGPARRGACRSSTECTSRVRSGKQSGSLLSSPGTPATD